MFSKLVYFEGYLKIRTVGKIDFLQIFILFRENILNFSEIFF